MPAEPESKARRHSELMFAPGGPETLLRVGPTYRGLADGSVPEQGTTSMTTGVWTLGPEGRPANGALGVLADDVLAIPVLAAHPPDCWAVSVEVSLDFCAPVPTDGRRLHAESFAAHLSPIGGLGRGTITDSDGTIIATGSQRLRFVPGTPDGPTEDPLLSGTGRDVREAPLLDLFGIADAGPFLRLPPDAGNGNPLGNLHGGVLLTFSEVAALRAAQSSAHPLDTASISITYIRPGRVTDEIVFRTELIHRGRTLAVVRVAAERPDGKACSVATVTCHGAS